MWRDATDWEGDKLDELLLLFFVDMTESDDDDEDDVDIDETDSVEVGDDATVVDALAVVADAAGTGAKCSRFALIHGCWRMSSMEILSAGRSLKHRRMRSWHS